MELGSIDNVKDTSAYAVNRRETNLERGYFFE